MILCAAHWPEFQGPRAEMPFLSSALSVSSSGMVLSSVLAGLVQGFVKCGIDVVLCQRGQQMPAVIFVHQLCWEPQGICRLPATHSALAAGWLLSVAALRTTEFKSIVSLEFVGRESDN